MQLNRSLRIFSSSQATAFVAFVVAYLIAIQYFRVVSAPDPSSVFLVPGKRYEQKYSLVRIKEADAFIAQAWKEPELVKASAKPFLCVGVPTVQRDGARYFKTLMGSMIDGLSDRERSEIYFMPFIANVDPNVHEAFKEPWLANVADRILTYETVSDEDRERLRFLEGPTGHVQKALFDYTYSMQGCLNTSAPYMLILEDDVISMDGWYSRTKAGLKAMEAKPDYPKSTYLRLFYNQGLQGWNSEFWPYYVCYSILWELFLITVIYLLHRNSPAAARFLTPRTILVILFICSPASVALYFAAGRVTVYPLRNGISRMNAYGCCSQAFVFPREQVPPLIDFFHEVKEGFRDSLIEVYADQHSMTRWALTPSVFQHIGTRSSKSVGDKNDQDVGAKNRWNWHFENFNSEKLHKEHLALIAAEANEGFTPDEK